MGHQPAGVHVGKAALDALDDLALTRDIIGDGLAGEEGFGASGPLGKLADSFLSLGRRRTVSVVEEDIGGLDCVLMCTD